MFLFNCNYAILYYNITSYSPRQALVAPAVVYFYCFAGDSMHNMNLSLILIPASGPIVSFKFSILCTSSSKTLPWPISTAVARRPQAASSPVKSTSPQDSSTPSAPPATAPPKNASPPANSKSSSPSSANPKRGLRIYCFEPMNCRTLSGNRAPLNQINVSEEP